MPPAAAARALTVHDGWVYFIHGWTRVIAEVFDVEIPTGNPLEIELDADLKPTAVRYLDQSRAEALPPLQ